MVMGLKTCVIYSLCCNARALLLVKLKERCTPPPKDLVRVGDGWPDQRSLVSSYRLYKYCGNVTPLPFEGLVTSLLRLLSKDLQMALLHTQATRLEIPSSPL